MKRARDEVPGGGLPAKRPSAPAARPLTAPSTGRLTTNDALAYLREVKTRFVDNKAVYDNFLEIMKQFKAQQIDTNGVIQQVKLLFRGHRELILGFNTFLPKGYEIQLTEEEMEPPAKPKQPVEFDQAISYVNKIKTRFQNNERVYKAFLEILNMYRKEEKTISEVYDEVAQLFRHHPDLLEEFTHFLPDSAPPRGYKRPVAARGPVSKPPALKRKINRDGMGRKDGEDDPKNKAANLARELQFFERVKNRLRNRDTYAEFMKCLHIFNADVISKMELRGLIYDILGRYPDLLAGFDELMARCESMEFEVAAEGRGKLSTKDIAKMKVISAREKFLSRPISELDLSMCERCGPSYRLLPKAFPKAPASARNDLHQAVLNDNWVSVTSGSEDFSFKAMRKNQYEESLFRCEDDRFELDMIIETNASVLAVLRPVAEELQAASHEERVTYKLAEGQLSAVHLRAVERIYGGDHGADVRELLQRSPAVAVPVVFARLVQKDVEWRRVREDMRRVWAEVYEKNYNKSLDHRSFYFKQADKKALAAKGMLAEIRELSERRKQAEEGPLGGPGAPGARGRGPSPDMTFTYGDRAVHDDVYAIVKFSIGEMMEEEPAQKLLAFWRSFLEPFFGVVRPQDGSAGYQDDVAERAAEEVLAAAVAEEEAEKAAAAARGGADAPAAAAAPAAAPGAPKELDGRKTGLAAAAAAAADDEEGGEGEPPAGGPAGAREPPGSSGAEEDEGEPAPRAGRAGRAAAEAAETTAQAARLAGCKPLAFAPEGLAAAAATAAAGGPATPLPSRVFYGHEPCYLLLRLHLHLYERLTTARASAAAQHEAGWVPAGEAGGAGRPPAGGEHAAFLGLLFRLLSGSLEASRYEDDCRALLGANSYVLFTLDKLIYKLIKQVQALAGDETVQRLLLLQAYEGARGGGAAGDAQYAADAAVLLYDEPAFRFASAQGGAELSCQLLEALGERPNDGGGAVEPRFGDYLGTFLHTAAPLGEAGCARAPALARGSEEDEEAGGVRRLFLARTLKAPLPASTRCDNGLECKVSCASSKVSYVLDTEDVLRARHAAAKGALGGDARAVQRFHDWLDARLHGGAGPMVA